MIRSTFFKIFQYSREVGSGVTGRSPCFMEIFTHMHIDDTPSGRLTQRCIAFCVSRTFVFIDRPFWLFNLLFAFSAVRCWTHTLRKSDAPIPINDISCMSSWSASSWKLTPHICQRSTRRYLSNELCAAPWKHGLHIVQLIESSIFISKIESFITELQ